MLEKFTKTPQGKLITGIVIVLIVILLMRLFIGATRKAKDKKTAILSNIYAQSKIRAIKDRVDSMSDSEMKSFWVNLTGSADFRKGLGSSGWTDNDINIVISEINSMSASDLRVLTKWIANRMP